MILDAIISLGGLIVPPVFDFIKKKFIKSGDDTPERTMATLATTKPESLPAYVMALANYIKAQVEFFNRDVVGELPKWVCAVRAAIRPCIVIVGLAHLILHGMFGDRMVLDAGVRYFYEANISSWCGARLTKD